MSVYTVGWLAWIGWFLVEEGIALFRGGSGATLSAHVWKWFATNPRDWQDRSGLMRLRRFGLLALMSWLMVHFMTGGRI